MKNIAKQDRTRARTPTDIERKYRFKVLEEVENYDDEITALKQNKVDKVEGKNLSSNDFTNGYKTQVEDNTNSRHTHPNKDVLDTFTKTQTEIDLELIAIDSRVTEATQESHTHPNKELLDSYTNSNTDITNAINRMHTHGNKSVLDSITQELLDSLASDGLDVLSYDVSDYNGYIWFSNGHLIQWGNATISPTSANTVTNATITFPMSYDYAPSISAVPQVAYPNLVTCSVGAGSTLAVAKTSMVIYMTRTNTSATTFRWLAEGYKAP